MVLSIQHFVLSMGNPLWRRSTSSSRPDSLGVVRLSTASGWALLGVGETALFIPLVLAREAVDGYHLAHVLGIGRCTEKGSLGRGPFVLGGVTLHLGPRSVKTPVGPRSCEPIHTEASGP
jgi:hypothetical protein